VTFEGTDFDGLEPIDDPDPKMLEQFTLAQGDLCGPARRAQAIVVRLDRGESNAADGRMADGFGGTSRDNS